jgi:hypothetical protein
VHNSEVRAVDEQIAKSVSWELTQPEPPTVGDLPARLSHAGYHAVAEAIDDLSANREIIVQWATRWLSEAQQGGVIHRGISLFYLSYVRVARGGRESIQRFVEAVFGEPDRVATSEKITATYMDLIGA